MWTDISLATPAVCGPCFLSITPASRPVQPSTRLTPPAACMTSLPAPGRGNVPGPVSRNVVPERHRRVLHINSRHERTQNAYSSSRGHHMPNGDQVAVGRWHSGAPGVLTQDPDRPQRQGGRGRKGERAAFLDGACCKGRRGLRTRKSQVIVREFAFSLLTGSLRDSPCAADLGKSIQEVSNFR